MYLQFSRKYYWQGNLEKMSKNYSAHKKTDNKSNKKPNKNSDFSLMPARELFMEFWQDNTGGKTDNSSGDTGLAFNCSGDTGTAFNSSGDNSAALPEGEFLMFGEQLYLKPPDMPDIRGVKVLRPGLHLGTVHNGRFIPSHALALWMDPGDFKQVVDIAGESLKYSSITDEDGNITGDNTCDNTPDDKEVSPRAQSYLRGETLTIPDRDLRGWVLILYNGFALGWGKAANGVIKNHYPKGLRR